MNLKSFSHAVMWIAEYQKNCNLSFFFGQSTVWTWLNSFQKCPFLQAAVLTCIKMRHQTFCIKQPHLFDLLQKVLNHVKHGEHIMYQPAYLRNSCLRLFVLSRSINTYVKILTTLDYHNNVTHLL